MTASVYACVMFLMFIVLFLHEYLKGYIIGLCGICHISYTVRFCFTFEFLSLINWRMGWLVSKHMSVMYRIPHCLCGVACVQQILVVQFLVEAKFLICEIIESLKSSTKVEEYSQHCVFFCFFLFVFLEVFMILFPGVTKVWGLGLYSECVISRATSKNQTSMQMYM